MNPEEKTSTQQPFADDNAENTQYTSKLTLEFDGLIMEMDQGDDPIEIGRDESRKLVVPKEYVSRKHATIEFRKGRFIFSDHSTNGTYIEESQDDFPTHCHWAKIFLYGRGKLYLGRHPSKPDASVVNYTVEE